MGQLLDRAQAIAWSREAKASGRRIVLTNGCFDLLHVGHLRYLQQAKALGDLLIVGVNSDESVRRLKGPSRPLNIEADRAELLAGLACVDAVTIFAEATADALLEAIVPAIYAKGGDYTVETLPEAGTLQRLGIKPAFVTLVPDRSTTRLVQTMQQTVQ